MMWNRAYRSRRAAAPVLDVSPKVFLSVVLLTTAVHAERYVKISAEIEVVERTWKADAQQPAKAGLSGSTNSWTVSVECVVGTNEWKLDGNFAANGRNAWFFDGTNVCESLRPTGLPDHLKHLYTNRSSLALTPPTVATSNLTINIAMIPGGYPFQGEPGVNFPWLAFCSGTYLKREGRIIPLPVAHFAHAPDIFAYSDTTKTFNDELGLPRTIDFFTSQPLYEQSARQFWRDASALRKNLLKSGFADGLRKCHYAVTESTNFFGWHLPLRFECVEDIPESFNGWKRSYRGEGNVTALSETSEPAGVFDPGSRQLVVDWRFQHETKEVNAIDYRWTNTFVPSTNDPYLQATFAAAIKRAPEHWAIRRRRARIVMFALVVIAAATPVACLLFLKHSQVTPQLK